MDKDTILKPRWTIFTALEEVEKWDYEDYTLLFYSKIFISDDYVIAEIELKDTTLEPTVENVFNDIPCLAIHEEWTNAVITTEESLPLIMEQYSWAGSGISFLTSMLTHNERIIVLNDFFASKKETVQYDEVMLSFDKEDKKVIQLAGNELQIINEDLVAILWGKRREAVWWPYFLEEADIIHLYLAIVEDEDDFDYPDLDDEGIFPKPEDVDPYYDYGYEYDSWVDRYCNERGFL